VLSLLQNCECLADIGSDHGYLVACAVHSGVAGRGIAVELNLSPFEQTRKTIAVDDLEGRVDVRLGDGLNPLKVDEVDAICIAGMGGKTIRDILGQGSTKLGKVSQLVLQPNVDAKDLRIFLLNSGFFISEETLVLDGEFIYQVIRAEPGTETCEYTDIEMEYGRNIIRKGGQTLQQTLNRDLTHWKRVLGELDKGSSASVERKKTEISKRIAELERLL
jgi:tRNA (adenine22-N1)-methyltransferase